MAHGRTWVGIAISLGMLAPAADAAAQVWSRRPLVEAHAGWAGFVDEETVEHLVLGSAVRFPVTGRLTVGPEVIYMYGPGEDRDLFVMAALTVDSTRASRIRRLVPFLVASGGFLRHSDRSGATLFSSYEGAVTCGAGVRIPITARLYVAPEIRVGWEPHLRIVVAGGYRLGG